MNKTADLGSGAEHEQDDDAISAWLSGEWPTDASHVARIAPPRTLRGRLADAIEAAACGIWRGLMAVSEAVRGGR